MADWFDPPRGDAWGGPTDWSLVAEAARAGAGTAADRSWEGLLERYRQPVRAAVRRRLGSAPDAEAVADAFFGYLFAGQVLARASRDRGRFRCFLQGVLRRYLAHDRASERRAAGEPLEHEPAVEETPEIERAEEADWAAAVLGNALLALARENPRGHQILVRVHGLPPWPAASVAALSEELGLKPNALHQALLRARRRLRELVLEEIRSTVASEPDYVQETRVVVARLLEAYARVFTDAPPSP